VYIKPVDKFQTGKPTEFFGAQSLKFYFLLQSTLPEYDPGPTRIVKTAFSS